MIGKQGRVTGRIGPGLVGEVLVSVRGGTEAFYAYAEDPAGVIDVNEPVLVVDYQPPRTVVVAAWRR